MKKILTMALLLLLAMTVNAQQTRKLKVYQKGGVVDTLRMNAASSISHSQLDLQGQQQGDYVMMVVSSADGEHQYLLSQLDSIVLPNGRTVIFRGSMEGKPQLAKTTIGWQDDLAQGDVQGSLSPRRSSFSGTFPGTVGNNNVTFYWTKNDHIRLDMGSESRADNLSNGNTDAEFLFTDDELDAPSYVVYYPDKSVTISTVQTQWGADNTEHIGESGDCGAATAVRQGDGSYQFTLEHKATYLCFLPHIDNLPSVKVTKIVLESDETNNSISGTYQLSKTGLYSPSNINQTITLHLNPVGENDFFIGHNANTEQDSCAAYMVIAPQSSGKHYMVTYYLTDTLSCMERIYIQRLNLTGNLNVALEANKVYPVKCHIPDELFQSVDLGLSAPWANRNVGATEPSKQGGDFVDAASANADLLAETVVTQWQIPTAAQQQELIDKCTWTWGEYNHIPGYLVTGASATADGITHRIFLPATAGQTPAQCLAANWRPIELLQVDLGLPSSTQWASRNIGADTPEDFGGYYSWGETEQKHKYNDNTYAYYNMSIGTGLAIAGTSYDIANVKWGSGWTMPTTTEMGELLNADYCLWELTTLHGVDGYKITSKSNGNSIFLPSAGALSDVTVSYLNSNCGSYLSSQGTAGSNNYGVCVLAWKGNTKGVYTTWTKEPFSTSSSDYYTSTRRSVGHTIRPVKSLNAVIDDALMNITTDGSNWTFGEATATLNGTLSSSTPFGTVEVGFVLGDREDVDKDNKLEILTENMMVAGTFSKTINLYENMGYWYRAYVKVGDEYRYGDAKHVGLEMVDMGLTSGIKWANMNVGASTPEERGDYFSWGETSPKERYAQADYEYYKNSTYQEIGADISGTQYDAATANWGKLWRMPSKADCEELLSHVTWSTVTINNVTYWKATSTVEGYEDRFLLFRQAGNYNSSGTALESTGEARFMTSTRFNDRYLNYLQLSNSYKRVDLTMDKFRGMIVRPVSNILTTIAGTTALAHVATEGCDYTVGATTATLRGSVATSAAVDGMTYGFVLGDNLSIDASTAASSDIIEASGKDAAGNYSIDYMYDGSLRYFRAYMKVGSTYYQGEVKSITAAMLDAVFLSDGTVVNAAFTNLPESMYGSPTVDNGALTTYGRYEAGYADNTFGSTANNVHSFYYGLNSEFRDRLADGHTLETVLMIPTAVPNTSESHVFSNYNNSGSAIMVKNKKIAAKFRINNVDKELITDVEVAADRYYHVVAVWNKDAGKLNLYVDGVLKSTMDVSGDLTNSSYTYYRVGARPSSNNTTSSTNGWTGKVVLARIYDEPLSTEQVIAVYNKVKVTTP